MSTTTEPGPRKRKAPERLPVEVGQKKSKTGSSSQPEGKSSTAKQTLKNRNGQCTTLNKLEVNLKTYKYQ
jgi:hypothetical protein